MKSVLFSPGTLSECVAEAKSKYPFESGGVFLGRYDDFGNPFITDMIGPGPNAVHARTGLEVDHDWQNAEIAKRYAAAQRTISFIGEWHTHPKATSADLSGIDKRTLLKLSLFKELRCPNPIMAILYPTDEGWRAGFWKISGATKILGVWTKISVMPVTLEFSDPT